MTFAIRFTEWRGFHFKTSRNLTMLRIGWFSFDIAKCDYVELLRTQNSEIKRLREIEQSK